MLVHRRQDGLFDQQILRTGMLLSNRREDPGPIALTEPYDRPRHCLTYYGELDVAHTAVDSSHNGQSKHTMATDNINCSSNTTFTVAHKPASLLPRGHVLAENT